MHERDHFSSYHPIVNLSYFAGVLLVCMCSSHPVTLLCSLFAALIYCFRIYGKKAMGARILYVLPMMLLAVLINVLFHHEGVTVLAYFPTGNPLTLESMVSAVVSGLILVCVIVWFFAISYVMTDEKLLYLFGRLSPSFALILCMTMRLIPHFVQRCKTVADTRRLLSQQPVRGVGGRIRFYASVLSGVVTWSLEESINTADSMRCRGYGSGERTAFFLCRFEKRDRDLLMLIAAAVLFMVAGMVCGVYEMRCYPTFSFVQTTPIVVCMHLASAMFFLLPFLLDIKDCARRSDTAA